MAKTKLRSFALALLSCVMVFALCLGIGLAPKNALAVDSDGNPYAIQTKPTANSTKWDYKSALIGTSNRNIAIGHEESGIIYEGSNIDKIKSKSKEGGISIQGSSSIYFLVPEGSSGTLSMNVYGTSSKRALLLYKDDKQIDGKELKAISGVQSFDFTADELSTYNGSNTQFKGSTCIKLTDNNQGEVKVEYFELTLNAVEEARDIYVHYNLDGGNIDGDTGADGIVEKTIHYNAGDEYNQHAENLKPVKAGYKFLGWTLSDKSWKDGEDYDFTENVTEELWLKAKWEKLISVTYDFNGGKYIGDPIDGGVEENGKMVVTLAEGVDTVHEILNDDMQYEGMDFHGWHIVNEEDGNATHFDFKEKIVSDIELIAIWNELNENNKVTSVDNFEADPEAADQTKLIYNGPELVYELKDFSLTRKAAREEIISEVLGKLKLVGYTDPQYDDPDKEGITCRYWEFVNFDGEDLEQADEKLAKEYVGQTFTYTAQLNKELQEIGSDYYTDLWLEAEVKIVDGRTVINKIDALDAVTVYPSEIDSYKINATVTANDSAISEGLSVAWDNINKTLAQQTVHGTVTLTEAAKNTMKFAEGESMNAEISVRIILTEKTEVVIVDGLNEDVDVWTKAAYSSTWITQDLTDGKEGSDYVLYNKSGLKVVTNGLSEDGVHNSANHKHTMGLIKLSKNTDDYIKITIPDGATADITISACTYKGSSGKLIIGSETFSLSNLTAGAEGGNNGDYATDFKDEAFTANGLSGVITITGNGASNAPYITGIKVKLSKTTQYAEKFTLKAGDDLDKLMDSQITVGDYVFVGITDGEKLVTGFAENDGEFFAVYAKIAMNGAVKLGDDGGIRYTFTAEFVNGDKVKSLDDISISIKLWTATNTNGITKDDCVYSYETTEEGKVIMTSSALVTGWTAETAPNWREIKVMASMYVNFGMADWTVNGPEEGLSAKEIAELVVAEHEDYREQLAMYLGE